MNKFKMSVLRQFGSENVSFTSEIESEKTILSDEELQGQVDQTNILLNKAFIAVQEREISEKALLVNASERRRVEVVKLDEALKQEMEQKKVAQKTMDEAEKLSRKLKK